MSYLTKVITISFAMATMSLNLGIFSEETGDEGDPFSSVRLKDQPMTDHRQLSVECKLPCNCTREPSCKAGVNIIQDGCGCCPMCARQQGDLCNAKDKCDEQKGLVCSTTGADAGFRGTCRAKKGKPCVVDGKEYSDGVQFHPNCSLLCTCQDGKYACSSKCPQELRAPSSVHCRDSHLVSIKDRCCKEWVCPHQHSMIDRDNNTVSDRCKKESTSWSYCSVTCGMGESIRVTSDNKECKPLQERRLCVVRPCDTENKLPSGKKCRSTYEVPPHRIRYENCESEKEYSLKYCTTCKRNRCCGPTKTRTESVSFRCPDSKLINKPLMFIDNCKCYRLKDCPFS